MIRSPFRYFKTSRQVIQLAVMMYIRYPLSLRNVEDLLHERGIDVCHESVQLWVDRFGSFFGSMIRKRRAHGMRRVTQWRWHLDELFVKIAGETHYLWRAIDHEGEVLEACVTKTRDKAAALKFLKKAMKRYGNPKVVVTDGLASYGAAMKEIGNERKRRVGRYLNNQVENSHLPFRRRERAMLRFRRLRHLQKFAAMHASVHNHFDLDPPPLLPTKLQNPP
jgi:putative transposase